MTEQPSLLDATADEAEAELSNRNAIKLLDKALEYGWIGNPVTSMVIRLTRDDATPFFIRWDLSVTDTGKKSWRFAGARAANGQALTFRDALLYLEDPSVIWPEPPAETEE